MLTIWRRFNQRRFFKSIFSLVSFSYFSLAFFVAAAFCAQQGIKFDSDSLYLPMVFQSVFVDGQHFSSWAFTPAPYFFPDMVVFLILEFCIRHYFFTFVAFAVFQCIATLFLASRIALLVSKQRNAVLITHILFLLMVGLLTFTCTKPYNQIIYPTFHFGTILNGLLLLYFVLLHIQKPARIKLVAIFFIVMLACMSDLLFLVQFLAPLLLTLLLFKMIAKTDFAAFRLFWVALLAFLISLLAKHQVHTGDLTNYLLVHQHNTSKKLALLYSAIKSIYFLSPAASCLIFIFYLWIGALCVKIFFNKNYFHQFSDIKKLHYFLYLLMANIFFVTFISLFINDQVNTIRYYLNIYWLPVCFGWILFWRYLPSIKALKILSVVLFLTACFLVTKAAHFLSIYSGPYQSPVVQCIDDTVNNYNAHHRDQIKYGISGYWEAKLTTVLSQQNVVLAQFKPDLSPNIWITSTESYRSAYDFAVISYADEAHRLDKNLIEKLNGPPILVAHCDTQIQVLIYGKNKLKLNLNE